MQLISREANQKLYMQLYEILKGKIENNEWPVGTMIPTEENLCSIFSVSRATVRTALLELVRNGYLKRYQGKGTFVFSDAVSDGLSMRIHFSELFLENAPDFSTTVFAQTVMMPIDDLDLKLDIPKDKHIIYIKRLRSLHDEPVLLQETYVPYHVCPFLLDEDIERQSLIDLFETKFGIKITKVKNYMEIAYLNTDEARLLRTGEGSPSIAHNQYFYSGETPVMYTHAIKRPDRFNFFIELERKVT